MVRKGMYLAVRIVMALARLRCCDLSSRQCTVMPVGKCVKRTALSVVLTVPAHICQTFLTPSTRMHTTQYQEECQSR